MNKPISNIQFKIDKATGEYIPAELVMGGRHLPNIRHHHNSFHHAPNRKLGFKFQMGS